MFKIEKPVIFVGPLKKQCEQFVSQKKALGCKYLTETYIMTVFDKFSMETSSPENVLTKEHAVEFAAKKPDESYKSFSNRACLIRQFGMFMVQMGYEAYVLPSFKVVKSSFVPHIFSDEELKLIFSRLSTFKPCSNFKLRHKIYPVLFRMLYGCGFRINEALHLKVSDVNLKDGIVTVRDAKWDTERLVPMSESLTKTCKTYFNEVHLTGNYTYFFPADDGGFISRSAILYNFKKVLKDCDIPYTARVHDFRHTFAVHTLNRWAREGSDIYVLLPILSKYMGHATISGTENYLRLTAEIYPDIVKSFEEHFSGVIPEVQMV